MKTELRKLVDGLRDAGDAAKAAADRAAFRAWADVAEALLDRAEEPDWICQRCGSNVVGRSCTECGEEDAHERKLARAEGPEPPVPTRDEVGSVSIIAWDPEFQTRSRWVVGVEFLKRWCRYYQEKKPLSNLAGGADAPCCPRCGYSGADDPTPIREGELWAKINALAEAVVARAEEPEQAARERLGFKVYFDFVSYFWVCARYDGVTSQADSPQGALAACLDAIDLLDRCRDRAEGKEPT